MPQADEAEDARAADPLLRALVEVVEAETGDSFFRALVRQLATALGVRYAFVSELTRGGTHFRTLALWARGAFGDNLELPLAGTPCEAVLGGQSCHYADGLQQRFPEDHGLVDWGVVSYAGVPVTRASGAVVGHFAILHDAALSEREGRRALDVMRIFAARARAELERQEALDRLRASEQQLENVIDSAADGIVVTDEAGTILLVNRAAERMLGCRAADAVGTPVHRFGTDEAVAARKVAEEHLARTPGARVFFGEEQGVYARRADGSLFLQEGSLTRSETGGRVDYTIVFRDVEERRGGARHLDELRRQNEYLREEIRSLYNFEEIVGRSRALRRVLEQVERVARTDASVLILGETGTGKELVARAIHAASPRRDRPLVKVSCAALSPGLVESELFGHEKGAFTGAAEARVGRFELAQGGTIFLDEVGEIPLDVQVKLLRVLQEREFERIGGRTTLRVDVRVIAATHRDLERAIAEGRFRQDLFYRLNVFPVTLPPLREREDDLPLLVAYFVERHAARVGRSFAPVSDATLGQLRRYPWPGNVRELENVIERTVILSRGPELEVPPGLLELPRPGAGGAGVAASAGAGRPLSLDELERRHIVETLRATGWRIDGPNGAAVRLGLHASTLRSRMKKLGIARSRDAAS
jgi:PAS domain S-box-containing protein